MLVSLRAVPLETRSSSNRSPKRGRIFWRAIYGICAAISVGSYFISYQHPPLSPAIVSPTAETVAFLHFILLWIGSLLSVGAPSIFGGAVLLLFLLLTVAAIRQMLRDRSWRPYYPWLSLGCFSLISACIAAATRLGFSYSMAGDARYAAFSAFLYIALLGPGIQRLQSRAKSLARDARGNADYCGVPGSLSDALDAHLPKGKTFSSRLDARKEPFAAGSALGRSHPAKSGDRLVVALPGDTERHSHSVRTRCVPAASDQQENGGDCDQNIKRRPRICGQLGANNAQRVRPAFAQRACSLAGSTSRR